MDSAEIWRQIKDLDPISYPVPGIDTQRLILDKGVSVFLIPDHQIYRSELKLHIHRIGGTIKDIDCRNHRIDGLDIFKHSGSIEPRDIEILPFYPGADTLIEIRLVISCDIA